VPVSVTVSVGIVGPGSVPGFAVGATFVGGGGGGGVVVPPPPPPPPHAASIRLASVADDNVPRARALEKPRPIEFLMLIPNS
jgi:hypothetical protein